MCWDTLCVIIWNKIIISDDVKRNLKIEYEVIVCINVFDLCNYIYPGWHE